MRQIITATIVDLNQCNPMFFCILNGTALKLCSGYQNSFVRSQRSYFIE